MIMVVPPGWPLAHPGPGGGVGGAGVGGRQRCWRRRTILTLFCLEPSIWTVAVYNHADGGK